jgi:hypothetical protein
MINGVVFAVRFAMNIKARLKKSPCVIVHNAEKITYLDLMKQKIDRQNADDYTAKECGLSNLYLEISPAIRA